MDEGVRVTIDQFDAACELACMPLEQALELFRFEEDAGKLRLYKVVRNYGTEQVLKAMGLTFDDVEPPKRLPSQQFQSSGSIICDVCGQVKFCMYFKGGVTNKVQLCSSCLGEMLAFLEMAEERDSRAKETTDVDWREFWGSYLTPDKGIVRKDGVP